MSEKVNKSNIDQFVHLHVHTHKSLRDAVLKLDQLMEKTLSLGMNAVAITEHGNMYSAMEFYKACIDTANTLLSEVGERLNIDKNDISNIKKLIPPRKNFKNAVAENVKLQEYQEKYPELFSEVMRREVKPIIGLEAYIIHDKEMAESDDASIKHTKNHLVLLAKDVTGYHQIIKANTKAQLLKDKKSYPRMTYDNLKEFFVGGHVIALSGCLQGELAQTLLDGDYEGAKGKALIFQSIFGKGNFFIEIQDHNIPEELKVLPQLIKISRETGIPMVATNDCHYADKKDAKVRDMVVAMRFGTTVKSPEFKKDCGELYIKSQQEMIDLFSEVPEAIENTVKIAEQCNIEFVKKKHFPVFEVPNGKSAAEYLTELTYSGIRKRFPKFDTWADKWKSLVEDRIKYELDIIISLHYDGYLLIVQDFLQEGRRLGLVGPGRGSAVGSLVCYLIGITNVNPLKYNLLFERFLNKDRVSDPDIDSDFSPMIRAFIIKYVQKEYGENAVSNIVTFGSLGAKAAIRAAGRVTGKAIDVCDKIAKMIPSKPGITIRKAMEENPDLSSEYDKKRNVKELIDDALLLEGLIVQTGVHAAGVIIADRDISDYVPMGYDEDEKIWITQYDKDICEADIGLLKMDFLGLENLNILTRTIEAIEKNYGIKINLDDINLDDKKVIKEIFAKGKTKAVFQFESSGMVNLLKRFQPQNLEDLILLNAAYRPGPLQYLDEIIEIKNKRKKPRYICSKMEEILDKTYSKPIYQEQIMSIFNEVAGFSLGVADIIRRAMAHKKLKELENYMPKFKEELIAAGSTKQDAEDFCEELIDFSRYAFNKSHSAAYAVVAYWTAWFKHYYPVEYMASVLTSASTKKLPVFIKECRDMEIPVLPPSVNESGRYFTATKNKTIRFGLQGVKNVGSACGDIIDEREKIGTYKSLMDYIERLSQKKGSRALHSNVMDSLIMTGAFDEFNLNRRQMKDGCNEYVKDLKDYQKKLENPKSRQKTKDAALAKVNSPHFDLELPEYEKSYLLEKEKELIGFYASGHPLDDYKKIIDEKAEIMVGDIDEDKDGSYVTIVGQINSYLPLFRKADGAAMGKFVMEDLTGEVNCICFTKAFKECGDEIKEGSVVILKGRVMADIERDPDTDEITNVDIQVSVNDVKPVNTEQKVYVKLKNIYEWKRAKSLLSKYAGNDELYVYFEDEEQVYKVKMNVRANQELKEEFSFMFGKKKLAVV